MTKKRKEKNRDRIQQGEGATSIGQTNARRSLHRAVLEGVRGCGSHSAPFPFDSSTRRTLPHFDSSSRFSLVIGNN
jgi:hypothetical protein